MVILTPEVHNERVTWLMSVLNEHTAFQRPKPVWQLKLRRVHKAWFPLTSFACYQPNILHWTCVNLMKPIKSCEKIFQLCCSNISIFAKFSCNKTNQIFVLNLVEFSQQSKILWFWKQELSGFRLVFVCDSSSLHWKWRLIFRCRNFSLKIASVTAKRSGWRSDQTLISCLSLYHCWEDSVRKDWFALKLSLKKEI